MSTLTRVLPLSRPWLRRMGKATFVFFLAKGLLWLVVPLIWYWVA